MVKNSIFPPMYANFYFNKLFFCLFESQNIALLTVTNYLHIGQCQLSAKQLPCKARSCKATSYCICYMTSKQADCGSVTCQLFYVQCSTLTLYYNCLPISYKVQDCTAPFCCTNKWIEHLGQIFFLSRRHTFLPSLLIKIQKIFS